MSAFIASAEFLTGARDPSKAKLPALAQIALVGRSNVGKSTLLNRLGNNKKLARTSATPGRTTEFNYFDFRLQAPGRRGVPAHFLVVDLPGFGYSKFSKNQREEVNASLVEYIVHEDALRAVCILNDCRRDPEDDELAVRQVAYDNNSRLIVVMTKCDKLKRNELVKQTKVLAAAYDLPPEELVQTGDGIALDPLWAQMLAALE